MPNKKYCYINHCENHEKYLRTCSVCHNKMSLYTYHKNKNQTIFCDFCEKLIKKYSFLMHQKTKIHDENVLKKRLNLLKKSVEFNV